jgi:hypothetical protein
MLLGLLLLDFFSREGIWVFLILDFLVFLAVEYRFLADFFHACVLVVLANSTACRMQMKAIAYCRF